MDYIWKVEKNLFHILTSFHEENICFQYSSGNVKWLSLTPVSVKIDSDLYQKRKFSEKRLDSL
jgi:hypothetical protein